MLSFETAMVDTVAGAARLATPLIEDGDASREFATTCAELLATIASSERKLSESAPRFRAGKEKITASLDAVRDDPKRLAQYAELFSATIEKMDELQASSARSGRSFSRLIREIKAEYRGNDTQMLSDIQKRGNRVHRELVHTLGDLALFLRAVRGKYTGEGEPIGQRFSTRKEWEEYSKSLTA